MNAITYLTLFFEVDNIFFNLKVTQLKRALLPLPRAVLFSFFYAPLDILESMKYYLAHIVSNEAAYEQRRLCRKQF